MRFMLAALVDLLSGREGIFFFTRKAGGSATLWNAFFSGNLRGHPEVYNPGDSRFFAFAVRKSFRVFFLSAQNRFFLATR